jgi:hypothetical protein
MNVEVVLRQELIVNFDGSIIAHGTTGRADEIITAEVRPDLVREARIHWGVENNIYQLWHRGYIAVKGGAMDCPYTFMQDMVAGTARLPWEDQVKVTDGTSYGFPTPTRLFGSKSAKAAEWPSPAFRLNPLARMKDIPAREFKRSGRHRLEPSCRRFSRRFSSKLHCIQRENVD